MRSSSFAPMALFAAPALSLTAATAAFVLYRHLEVVGDEPNFATVLGWQAIVYGLWAPIACVVWRLFRKRGLARSSILRFAGLGAALIPIHAFGATFIDIGYASPGATDLVGLAVQRVQLDILIYAGLGLFAIAAELQRVAADEGRAAAVVREALARAREQLEQREIAGSAAGDRLMVSAGTKRVPVEMGEVEWFGSASNYVVVNWQDREGLIRQTLQSLENRLDPISFARIHRGTIVNLAKVESAQPLSDGSWRLVMSSGTELVASRTYRTRILERLSGT